MVFVCKQKTAYERRRSDGSSDVCSAERPPARGTPAWSRSALSQCSATWRLPVLLTNACTAPSVRARPASISSQQVRRRWRLPQPWRWTATTCAFLDRKSVVLGKRGVVRVDSGVRRIINKKKKDIERRSQTDL